MKKIVSVLLVFIVCLSAFPCSVSAQNNVLGYSDDERKLIHLNYTSNEDMLNTLFNDDSEIAYWYMVNDTEKNNTLKMCIDLASKVIGEYPNKQDYAEILANLITMQSGNIAEQVQNQSQFDDFKDGIDYAMDIVDIVTEFIGGDSLLKDMSPIIDAVTGGADVIIDNIEQAKYYETTIQDYSQSKIFLESISEYAQNKELRNVAKSLLVANDKLLERRLEYISNSASILSTYEAEFFIENMSLELLKASDIYNSDETVKWYVDCGEKLGDSIGLIFSQGAFAFKMTMLAGNIGFGTSNMFNRYQEMKIIADIASAIIKANNNIVISKELITDSTLSDIKIKCDYYKMLITAHARGEYLVYQILINDAGLLSDFRVIFDYFKDPKDTTDSWYSGQIDTLLDCYNILDKIFKNSDDVVSDETNGKIDIPSAAIEYNGHSYCYFDDGLSWHQAKDVCEAMGGYLATLTTEEENKFIKDYVEQGTKNYYWLGGTDESSEGTWQWITNELWQYTNWLFNQPDNHSENNGCSEHYLTVERQSRGWNDLQNAGDTSGKYSLDNAGYICEWSKNTCEEESNKEISSEREIVLVLDVSSSMSGTPLDETKKASVKFINTVLDDAASVGIVTYDNSASRLNDFSINKTVLTNAVSGIQDGGGTNIESGLVSAQEMLKSSNAKKKIIVLMSDGEPNGGKVGDDLIEYAQTIKNEGVYIYTLGFFEDLGSSKSSAQILMEKIASEGCHYEVANADDLVFFFGDIADQLNGQKYVYIRIACPTDVIVEYGGESLCSSDKNFNDRTSFGAMTLEDVEDSDEKIKTLRLKDGVNYDIKIEGTGRGRMDYTIGYMDDSGEYTDFRKFKNIPITKKTVIDTKSEFSNKTVLKIDEDGDGRYDSKYQASENGTGELVDDTYIIYIILGVIGTIIVLTVIIVIIKKRKKEGK